MENIITTQENAQSSMKDEGDLYLFFKKEEGVVHLEYALQGQILNHYFCTQDISVM